MRRLDRRGIEPPADWRDTVAKALPDAATYEEQARRFEALGVNSRRRRGGFAKFAPEVLPKKRGRPHFPARWGAAKDAMARMSAHKCAYCETTINARRSGQVEHFRPKSLFPTLAYEWDNYFLACGGCNGAKADKWPREGTYVRPDEGDPPRRFAFTPDGRVRAAGGDAAAACTVEDLDLNGGWLVLSRRTAITKVLEDAEALIAGCPPSLARRLVRDMYHRLAGEPRQRYSVALMQCLRQVWEETFPGERL